MPDDSDDIYYDLRVPTTSSIYPRATPEETLCALLDANESRPANKRFPVEILLHVNDELHPPNPLYEQIRSIWTVEDEFESPNFYGKHLENVLFDTNTKTFYISDLPFSERFRIRKRHRDINSTIPAADLLYRMRCLFPDVPIYSEGPDGYKWMWTAAVRHNQSGINFEFSERRGGAKVTATWITRFHDPENEHEYGGRVTPPVPQSKKEADDEFTTDALQLLNFLFGTIDGRRFTYYHPAADADHPAADERFLAVPSVYMMERIDKENLIPYKHWHPVMISAADLSSFKSLLPDMKYNIESRKVDPVNGTADLTTILSSSQLFYRLLCHYVWPYNNVNDTSPTTSVWQVKLGHVPNDSHSFRRKFGPSVIFMDDRGLFDIRVEEGAEKEMDDLVDLVNALFSDECCHPYDGVVAGCTA